MLKKIRLLFLGLIVLAGSACVTPTHASSAYPVLITYIQASGSTGAKEELIVLHNNAMVDIDVTDWCLRNKASVAFACLADDASATGAKQFILPGYGSATVVSHEYAVEHELGDTRPSFVYEVTNQSSGSIVSSADSISLVTADGEVADTWAWSWTGTPPATKAWGRLLLLPSPELYATGNDAADWSYILWRELPQSSIFVRMVNTPPGEEGGEGETGEETGETNTDPDTDTPGSPGGSNTPFPVQVSEVFANPAGADAGKEFIELYNTDTTTSQQLDSLKLKIGGTTPKWYVFPNDTIIAPGGFLVITDTDLGFSLVNATGGVQLYDGDIPLGERVEYISPKDDMSWALINGTWQYTSTPTPGKANFAEPKSEMSLIKKDETTPKPCASNQYRNPETGRCKLLSAATKTSTPCKAGQERNPETNRCRTIAAEKVPTPCKEGQERNPETNRCRAVVKMSTVGYGVKGVQTKADAGPSWYYWAGIGAVLILILTYAVWEWREELAALGRRLRTTFAKR